MLYSTQHPKRTGSKSVFKQIPKLRPPFPLSLSLSLSLNSTVQIEPEPLLSFPFLSFPTSLLLLHRPLTRASESQDPRRSYVS